MLLNQWHLTDQLSMLLTIFSTWMTSFYFQFGFLIFFSRSIQLEQTVKSLRTSPLNSFLLSSAKQKSQKENLIKYRFKTKSHDFLRHQSLFMFRFACTNSKLFLAKRNELHSHDFLNRVQDPTMHVFLALVQLLLGKGQ